MGAAPLSEDISKADAEWLENLRNEHNAQVDALLKEQQARLDELLKQLPQSYQPSDELLAELFAANEAAMAEFKGELAVVNRVPPDPNLTARDAALWMQQEIGRADILHHATVVRHLLDRFGERFTRRNQEGNRVVAFDVLDEFLTLSREDVVWSRKDKLWRKRRPSDPPSRMVE
jgi:hypothetical protein